MVFLDCENSLDVLRAGQIANVILGSVLPLLGFLLFRRRLGQPWPLLGAVILATLPLNIIASKGDLSEMSFSCFLLGA